MLLYNYILKLTFYGFIEFGSLLLIATNSYASFLFYVSVFVK